ncbi:MAG: FAD-dependent oxidoreductase, partial [Nitrospinaceae bacterium]|nr:FAD-dependent oxidoreductase [Nitrospinaceae bacterium]
MDEFDIAVIGAGPAGVTAALRGAERGARVCLIEQDRIGGSCFRKGLYPTKAVMALIEAVPSENGSVDVRQFFKSIDEFGESLSQNWRSKLDDRGVQT